jgi:hypothetical protein
VLTTFFIAWPLALCAIHFGWSVHGLRSEGGRAWADSSGAVFSVSRSQRWLGDWWQVFSPSASSSVLPLGEKHPLPGWVATPSRPPSGEKREDVSRVDTAAHGWPWRCLASESWMIKAPTFRPGLWPMQYREVLRGNLVLAETTSGRTIMPLRPVWGGLAADVALWSAGWLVLLRGFEIGRAARRRRAGRCASCGYDRRGLDAGAACPECGRTA